MRFGFRSKSRVLERGLSAADQSAAAECLHEAMMLHAP